jgi:type IV secretory pathway TrbD component
MNNQIRIPFLRIIVVQGLHSIEEFFGKLWEVYLPATFLSGLVSANLKTSFIIINIGLFIVLILTIEVRAQAKDDKKNMEVFQKEIDYRNSGDIDCYTLLYAPVDSVRMLLKQSDIYGRDNIKAF